MPSITIGQNTPRPIFGIQRFRLRMAASEIISTDWEGVPIEHIDIDSANEWAAKKRVAGLSWTTIKDALRTMLGVLSAYSKGKKPPFSQRGLKVPERDKLRRGIGSRNSIARPVFGMTEIIPSAKILSVYLWDTILGDD
jgi:hypothetical protein